MKNKFLKLARPLHYVIGHGLFFSYETFKEASGFPQDETNEDAFLGYIFYNKSLEIETVPHLEQAEIAKNLKVYVKQQSVWFNGPFMAFKYFLKLIKGSVNDNMIRDKVTSTYHRTDAFLGAFKLFFHAIYWALGPILIWFIMPVIFIVNKEFTTLLFWFLIAVYHAYGINIITHNCLKGLFPKQFTKVKSGNVFKAIAGYILHCVGPLIAIYKSIRGKNSLRHKYKTEK